MFHFESKKWEGTTNIGERILAKKFMKRECNAVISKDQRDWNGSNECRDYVI